MTDFTPTQITQEESYRYVSELLSSGFGRTFLAVYAKIPVESRDERQLAQKGFTDSRHRISTVLRMLADVFELPQLERLPPIETLDMLVEAGVSQMPSKASKKNIKGDADGDAFARQ